MSIIIAAGFAGQEEVAQGVDRLVAAGIGEESVCTFYFNPAGHHDLHPLGGDCDASPSAKSAGGSAIRGAAEGGIAGAAIGVAGMPFGGPLSAILGASVGAYVGSLVGGLSGLKDADDRAVQNDYVAHERKSAMIVAVQVQNAEDELVAIETLRACGGANIERAEGRIVDRDWIDFDPLSAPTAVGPTSTA
jgi:hypothetical protein